MSAVATTEAVPVTDAPIHLVEGPTATTQQMHDTEMKRWMLWFGLPALIGCVFLGIMFATGDAWWLGLALTALSGRHLRARLARDDVRHERAHSRRAPHRARLH